MDRERYQKILDLFEQVFQRPEDERSAFLDEHCADDPTLRREVATLLRRDGEPESGPFAETSLSDPDSIGEYRVVRRLGAGGMGIVFEAEQEQPRRRVALKLMLPSLDAHEFEKRFDREIELLGRLKHPGVAQIYAAGSEELGRGRQPWFAMELIEGQNLTAHVEALELGVTGRLELFAQICDAVDYAHEHGVVHRDLKPDNILVQIDGQPKVLDFGVARSTDADVQLTAARTDVGRLIGTLAYMSPEQATGDTRVIDRRSDVYSLGVVLFELLTGRLPYAISHRSIPEVVRVIRETDPTRLSSVDRIFRGDLDTIVAKALEKEPDRRYASAAELASDVRRYVANEPIAARAPSRFYQLRKSFRRHPGLVGGVILAITSLSIGLGLAVRFGMHASERSAAAQRSAYRMGLAVAQNAIQEGQMEVAQRLLAESPVELRGWEWRLLSAAVRTDVATWTSGSEQGTAITVTSDGRAIGALCAGDTLLIRDLRTSDILHELTGPGPLTHPALSSEGTHAAVFGAAQKSLLVFDLVSGATTLSLPIELGEVSLAPYRGAALSADGHRVAVSTTPRRLTVLETSTGRVVQQHLIRQGMFDSHGGLRARPRFRPDGGGVFFWFGANQGAYIDLTTGQNHLASPSNSIGVATWDATGETLWLSAVGELYAVRPPSFDPFSVLTHSNASQFGVRATAFSPDGTRCAIGAPGRVSIFDLATSTAVRHLREEGAIVDLRFDSTGDRLFVAQPGRIRVHSLRRTPSTVLQGHDSFVYHAAFSPDGQLIASQDFAGQMCLWDRHGKLRASIDRSGINRRRGEEVDPYPVAIAFSRDGHMVLDLWRHVLRSFDVFTEQIHLREQPEKSEDRLSNRDLFFGKSAGGTNERSAHRSPKCTDPGEILRADGNRRELSVRKVESGETIAHPVLQEKTSSRVSALAIDAARRWLAFGDSSGVLRVWDLKRDRLLAEIPNADEELLTVSFHPDGQRLASGGIDGVVRIWETERWELVAELRGHADYVHDLKFSPDGSQLVSASGDKTLRLWDIRTASELAADDEAAHRASAAIRLRVNALLESSGDLDAARGRMESDGWSEADRSAARGVFIEEFMRSGRISFDPTGRNRREAVSVRLSTPSDRASIHYTLDGSEPTTDSPVYVDPVRLFGRTVISARAFPYGVPGPVSVHHFAFDPFAIPLVGTQWETWGAEDSAWAFKHGVLRQRTNAGFTRASSRDDGAAYYGTMRIYGGTVGDDGELRVRLRAEDRDAIGVAFRFQSLQQHYLFHWDRVSKIRSLIRRNGDEYVCLDRDDVPHERSRWYDVNVVLDGPRIAVHVDGEEVLSAVDATYPGGTFALHAVRCTNADFAALAFEPQSPDSD